MAKAARKQDPENVYRDTYFKDRPEGVELMSGMPLPKDPDGKVRDKVFIDCDFHFNCDPVENPGMYENCRFE